MTLFACLVTFSHQSDYPLLHIFFSPVTGRYLVMYSYTDTRYVICEFEIYGTLWERPGEMNFSYISVTFLREINLF